MTRDIKTMSTEELQAELSEMEDTYAELLGDDSSNDILNPLWEKIKELKAELERRK